MTVHQLHPPAAPAAGLIAEARAAVEAGGRLPAGSLTDAEVESGIAELAALESQVAAWRLGLMAEADVRRLARERAETGTDALLSRLTGDTREVMRGGLLLARLLKEKYTATLEAFAAGDLRMDQVWVIVRAAEKAPRAPRPSRCVRPRSCWSARPSGGPTGRGGR